MALKNPEPMPVMKFKIVSAGCEIELVNLKKTANGEKIARPIYEFAYTNRPGKPNFTTYIEEIDRSVRNEYWVDNGNRDTF